MNIARVDTHIHHGGAIPVSFIWDTIRSQGLYWLAESLDDVIKSMTFTNGQPRNYHHFLNKFKILDDIRWSAPLIDQSISAVCTGLKNNNVDYALLSMSINKYMAHTQWPRVEMLKYVHETYHRHRPGGIGLLLAIKYETLQAARRQYVALIENPEVANIIRGIDLVGDEDEFDATYWGDALTPWIKAGKIVRAHVGELGPVDNIRAAITKLRCNRIAHGFKIIEDPELIQLAIDLDICFDLGITSNYLTGVITGPHPIKKMINVGLHITLGTDDPVICETTLDQEYDMARKAGVSNSGILSIQRNAALLCKI